MYGTNVQKITEEADLAVVFCHNHNATVKFNLPNGVELKVPGIRKIYAYSLHDAVETAREILDQQGDRNITI